MQVHEQLRLFVVPTLKFVKIEEKRALQDAMTYPNSKISSRQEWKASHVTLESSSKSTLSKDMSFNHWRASNKPIASPTTTRCKQGKHTILAKRKVPSSSRIHIPIPILLKFVKNAASTLHL